MLRLVDVGVRSMVPYRGVVTDALLDELVELAGRLRGARVLHLNATPYGGGVSELLRSVVPLMNDLGLHAEWRIISGDEAFFEATKRLHNALQGAAVSLTEEQRGTFLANTERNVREMESEYDFVIVNDPQPAAIPAVKGRGRARWVWRCHIDTSSPNHEAWDFLRPYLASYDAVVYTMAQFAPPDGFGNQVHVIPPAIDPLSPKNVPLPDSLTREVLDWIGVELGRPLITQVSRFDPWKDPLGVIAAYRLVRERIPNLQLALVGSMALDDPEGWRIYDEIQRAASDDPLVHVFTNLTGVGNIEVNAFQRLSDVVVQKSIREGFGLVVSEAMWKGTPVVAGRAGGIPLQMEGGVGGLLVDSVEECAEAILQLLENPELAWELGRTGQERVRGRFLLPRLVRDELALLADLAAEPAAGPAVEEA